MALHELKITVIDGGKAESSAVGLVNTDDSAPDDSGSSGKNGSLMYGVLNFNKVLRDKVKQATSPTTYYALQQGVALAKQAGREIVNYYVSDIGRANGDSNYQAIVNRQIEQVTDAMSIGEGILGGMGAGAATGNPIGVVVGALVGAASSGINLGFKYAERERAYQHEMFQENTSQAYQLARANYSAHTGRVR